MSDLSNKVTMFDKMLGESWYSTPDMGEYINNKIYKDNMDGISENSKDAEFFVENPPTLEPGYHEDLGVVAISCNGQMISQNNMNSELTEKNIYDGDTIKIGLDYIHNTSTSFQLYYSDTIFKGVKHYIKESCNITDDDLLTLRFIGLDAPEIVHYQDYAVSKDYKDIYETTWGKLKGNNSYVSTNKGQVLKSQINYKNFNDNNGEYSERKDTDKIKLLRITYDKKSYPSIKSEERTVYHEICKENVSIPEKSKIPNMKVYRCVASYAGNQNILEYAKQAKKAQKIVKDAFSKAKETIILLDTAGLNGKKALIPEEYKKSYEKSTFNPFYALYDMWNSLLGKKAAYLYSGYRVPGQETNGRFLAAVYVKIRHNGVDQWINLNKKIIYECDLVTPRPAYTNSVDAAVNNFYAAKGFKLWTYDKTKQLYIDKISDEILKNKDDRKEIQEALTGCNLDYLYDHTVMIGDCLFMIPPTAIRAVSQTKTSKIHLIRAKGAVSKTLPKTERIIQMDLYFNKGEGINGIPVNRELPNGTQKTYYMNGLRSLIAQFKLTPFLPIHNKYINQVLDVQAVALVSYEVTTLPNYPRTLKATISMYEFDWIQYMPSQAMPDLSDENSIFKNGFSDTIHFPLLRFYYQKALERGQELKTGIYENLSPNDKPYISATLGNRTALQPADFKEPTIDIYVPNDDHLRLRKQLKMEMLNRPLGQRFEFSDKENKWINKMYDVNVLANKYISYMSEATKGLSTPKNTDAYVVLKNDINFNNKANYQSLITGKGDFVNHKIKGGKITETAKELAKRFLTPCYESMIKDLNASNTKNIITNIDIESVVPSTILSRNFNLELSVLIKLNHQYFDTEESIKKIRKFVAKNLNITTENIFKNYEIRLTYIAEFSTDKNQQIQDNDLRMTKPFSLKSSSDIQALEYLSSFTDSKHTDGSEDFDINKELENLKDSIDIEDEESIKFDKFDIGTPIITSINSTYNNIFGNISLKSIDGHAAQYTGGSDSTIDVEMIADEFTVGQLNFLTRLSVKNLIDYRKIMRCSPIRIDSDFTRLLGIYEVIIDSIDIANIENQPGYYNVSLRISSVDRTLRNRESLRKIKGIDNHNTQKDSLINTKNYFDFKDVLGKAEIYPDLELPTITELEMAGFYFLSSKYQPERVYVDPDFYFLYWYPTFSEMLKTSIVEFFSDPQNITRSLSDDIFDEAIRLDIPVNNNEGESLYSVMGFNESNPAYDKMVDRLRELAKKVKLNGEEGKLLNESQQKDFVNVVSRKMDKIEKSNKIINKLTETIENATYGTFQVNKNMNVSAKDIDILDVSTESEKKKIENKNKEVIKAVKEALNILPRPRATYSGNIVMDILKSERAQSYNFFKPGPVIGTIHPDYYESIDSISEILFGKKLVNDESKVSIGDAVRGAAVGYLGRQSILTVTTKEMTETKEKENTLCFPPHYYETVDEKGNKKEYAICLYEEPKISELAVAYNEDTVRKSIIFGRFAIKKYGRDQLSKIFNIPFKEDGFLDPMVNSEIHELMFGEKKTISKETMDKYLDGIKNDVKYAADCHFRQMLVWFYVLLERGTLINFCHLYAGKLIEVGEKGDEFWDNKMIEELSKSLFDNEEEHYDAPSAVETVVNSGKNFKYKDEFNQLLGENAFQNANKTISDQEERIRKIAEEIKKNSEDYCRTLLNGLFYTLSAITMSGLESTVLEAVSNGDLGYYGSVIEKSLATTIFDNLSEEQKRLCRFAQYVNFSIDEDNRYDKNPIQQFSYNNRVQRAYLKAANDPKVYMLHSYYDMVMHDKRGSMARAFPTFYMLLIDEGRKIGLWKLQDNFYHMNSISEFEVVKSRKIAADTARIVMTNLHGVFNNDDEDMKDEYSYTLRDVWDSIFSPRSYFQEEYVRRGNSREINSAKMQPGARVHLRMGYSANAANLPIVFNGTVAEFETGEMMTLVCQGDGVELANPHMFNAIDAKDTQDIRHNDKFIGYKWLRKTWDNLSTPRDMLTLPLAAEGTYVQELVRKLSSGRFFNANPFGIVHFGDRNYKEIFTANGEVEQNIYEGISKPTWNYEKSGITTVDDGLEKEWSLSEVPRVIVPLEQGMSYWDLMHLASSLSPDFISAIAPFQLRSTIFHGHPRFYYAYDYIKIDGKIMEKRKPFQQYHIYTSYSDIIDNKIATSRKEVRTNAVGYYTGTGWWSSTQKRVGPLFLDIDIFPENQQSTSVNLNFRHKNNDILPFNVPIGDKIIDTFGWSGGPNGEKTAWRATASALKDCVKDMYKGELLVIGDPTVKPFDRMCISDIYEDMAGTCEVESVVHMFSTETGFVSSITPDCISAIDNKYETISNGYVAETLAPAILGELAMVGAVINFNKKNRPAYLAISRASKKGADLATKAFDTALTVVGKETMKREGIIINSSLPSAARAILDISPEDIKIFDTVKDMLVSKKFIPRDISNGKGFIKAINNFELLDDIFKNNSTEKIKSLQKLLSNPRYADTEALKLLGKVDNNNKFIKAINAAKAGAKLDGNDINLIVNAIEGFKDSDDEMKAIVKMIKGKNSLDLTSSEGKTFLKAFKNIGNKVDDFSSAGLGSIAELLTKKGTSIKKQLSVLDELDDIAKVAGRTAASGAKSWKSLVSLNIVMLIAEIVITKGVQNYITNKLRNLQVLTVFPLKKNNRVYTAGLEGHQGSVFGSPAYNEPGFLEEMAIKFFDYGKDAPAFSGASILGFIRDIFITTPEMNQIVDGYKRGNNYVVDEQSPDKTRVEAQTHVLETMAKEVTMSYADYKNIYATRRITMGQVKNKDYEAKKAFAKYRISGIRNIEQSTEITSKLKNIIYADKTGLMQKLYKEGALKLSYDYDIENKNIKSKTVSILEDGTSQSVTTSIREIGNSEPKVYDIPYLRDDALKVFYHFVNAVLNTIQKDYETPNSALEEIKKNPIVFHSGTRINSTEGWRATGYLFTVEVKNYNGVSNIIKEIEKNRNELAKEVGENIPFTIKSEAGTEFGPNAYSFFVHCPTV